MLCRRFFFTGYWLPFLLLFVWLYFIIIVLGNRVHYCFLIVDVAFALYDVGLSYLLFGYVGW